MISCASEANHTHTHTSPVSNKHDSLTLHLGSIHLDQVPDKCEEEDSTGTETKRVCSPPSNLVETLQLLYILRNAQLLRVQYRDDSFQ